MRNDKPHFTKKKLHVMNKDICNIEDATYIDEVKDHIGTSVGKVEGFREERFNKHLPSNLLCAFTYNKWVSDICYCILVSCNP